jgi:hypothetical protein
MILSTSVHPSAVIIITHDKTLKVTQSTGLIPPPPLPVGGVQVEAAFPRETGKGKVVVKGKLQGGGDSEDSDDERMTKLSTTHPIKITMICPHSASPNRQANILYFPRSIALI